jgi:hypothetical protein
LVVMARIEVLSVGEHPSSELGDGAKAVGDLIAPPEEPYLGSCDKMQQVRSAASMQVHRHMTYAMHTLLLDYC